MGALSNKGGRGQRNREEIGAEATYFSRGFAARSRALRARISLLRRSPLLRPTRQNRHATQAITEKDVEIIELGSLLCIGTNCAHLFPILLDMEKMRSTGV